MRKFLLVFLIAMFVLTACSSQNAFQEETTTEYEKISMDILSEEQIKYLTEEAGYTTDSIVNMSYEGVNWHLLGTGLELYNASSGVEKYGIEYDSKADFDYTLDSNSEKKITMAEVYAIRAKEKNIRVEDMKDYLYEVEMQETGFYKLYAPVDEYEETYLVMAYRINDDGTIKMLVPHLACGEEKTLFSIYYDQTMFNAYNEYGEEAYEDKVYFGIQYSSVTSKSLVLQLFNYKETGYSYKGNLVIYDENNKECMKLDADYSVKLKTSSIFPVKFDKELEKGKYTIKIGEDYSLDFEVK